MVRKILKTTSNSKSLNTKIDKKGLVSRHAIIDKILTLTTPIWDSKAKRLKPKMTIAQACSEVEISPITYHSWLREDPLLAQMVEDVYSSHRQMMDDMAQGIIMEGLNGGVKLRPSERIGFAFRYLEKTSPHFNPAQKVELEDKSKAVQMSEEEILQRLNDLMLQTGENITLPNNINQEDVKISSFSTNTPSESTINEKEDDGIEESGGGADRSGREGAEES